MEIPISVWFLILEDIYCDCNDQKNCANLNNKFFMNYKKFSPFKNQKCKNIKKWHTAIIMSNRTDQKRDLKFNGRFLPSIRRTTLSHVRRGHSLCIKSRINLAHNTKICTVWRDSLNGARSCSLTDFSETQVSLSRSSTAETETGSY